jgi:hypothetical protein
MWYDFIKVLDKNFLEVHVACGWFDGIQVCKVSSHMVNGLRTIS